MKIGVLALQGDFVAHARTVSKLGASPVSIKKKRQLAGISGLILPGGESSTIIKLMEQADLVREIDNLYRQGCPIFGTCAGLILMAKQTDRIKQFCFSFMDVEVQRNAYGPQKESFSEQIYLAALGKPEMECIFIRAPKVISVSPDVEVLASWRDMPILVRQGKALGATFHPELTDDGRIHQMFLQMCKENEGYEFG